MAHIRRIILVLILVLSSVGCDQSTKYLADQYLKPFKTFSYLNDTFRFQYIENTGGFLGVGGRFAEEFRFVVFRILVPILLTGLLIFVLFNSRQSPVKVAGFSLIVGGGLSNLIDRIINNGAVVDFMNMGIGSLRTGIFNVADVIILSGVVVLALQTGRRKKRSAY